ncbi:MAG: purine-nucleoside phosphorylase [Christensenellales bacterium]
MNKTPTPHIEAKFGEIAQTVILPGDPLRAKKMAKKYLKDAKLVSSVRNNFCYTGTYNGKPVSIMSTGMGPASMGIYAYELFNYYGVKNAIRVGTIGSLNPKYCIGDILIAQNCYTNTNLMDIYQNGKTICGTKGVNCFEASDNLLHKMLEQDSNLQNNLCNIWTTDTFYSTLNQSLVKKLDIAGVEMEGASLYLNAKLANANALCLCTVSDEIYSGKCTTSSERENNFFKMFELALSVASKL